ncbi:iron-sulfur cluster assembly scaffold protein [Candidatus Aerophobetes bacterium]|nr:iron-sulfur cluster assembly scaffold protein [Candidatus Aerophobetes bacterium]
MDYTEKVCEYSRNPKNMGRIIHADGVDTAGNPVCGDVMKIYIKVRENGIIEDINRK